MKISFSLTAKNIFRYLYLALVLANIIILFFLYNFLNKYVYSAIVTNREFIISQALKHESDINIKKFEQIIKKIDAETNRIHHPVQINSSSTNDIEK